MDSLFDTIFLGDQIRWQYPSLTEKQAFLNHENRNYRLDNNIYIGCAWASIIDYIENHIVSCVTDDFWNNCEKSRTYLNSIIDKNQLFILDNLNSHTVCQHIHWYKLLGYWQYLGIKNIWISHNSNTSIKTTNIDIHSWTLIATNTEIPDRNTGLYTKNIQDKKYLCSFIGAYNNYYRSNIRLEIKKVLESTSKNNIYYHLYDDWFDHDVVYEHQIKNKTISIIAKNNYITHTKKYNELLSDSVFSLCPEGTGPNTLRLWESMSVGSIPVLFENDWIPPEINEYDWNDISIVIPITKTKNLLDILEEIPQQKIKEMQENCINAYRYFRNKTCF